MTLEGTNTWLLHGADEAGRRAIVVDPGPDDEAHLGAVVAAAGEVVRILLTHGHPDHSDGARRLHDRTGAPVSALDPRWQFGGSGLHEGDVVAAAGVELRVWATPGHTADSLSFVWAGSWNSETAVASSPVTPSWAAAARSSPSRTATWPPTWPRCTAWPSSATSGCCRVMVAIWPTRPSAALAYLAHREQRLGQVREALSRLGLDPVPAQCPGGRRGGLRRRRSVVVAGGRAVRSRAVGLSPSLILVCFDLRFGGQGQGRIDEELIFLFCFVVGLRSRFGLVFVRVCSTGLLPRLPRAFFCTGKIFDPTA